MTLQPVPTELCSQLDEEVPERKMGHFLPASAPTWGLQTCAEAASMAQPVCAWGAWRLAALHWRALLRLNIRWPFRLLRGCGGKDAAGHCTYALKTILAERTYELA
eukprot:s2277_g13.t1